ncbi:MAG: hypothetical protein AAF909_07525 [Pseudomonadota bacterium]
MDLDPDLIPLYLVLAGFVVVLISDLIGNTIAFSNRLVNAVVTGVVFTIIFGGIAWYILNNVTENPVPQSQAILVVLFGGVVVVISDLIGNSIAFGNRIVNALVTGTVFAVIFGAILFYGILPASA